MNAAFASSYAVRNNNVFPYLMTKFPLSHLFWNMLQAWNPAICYMDINKWNKDLNKKWNIFGSYWLQLNKSLNKSLKNCIYPNKPFSYHPRHFPDWGCSKMFPIKFQLIWLTQLKISSLLLMMSVEVLRGNWVNYASYSGTQS